ncbi:hypothetical protein F5146DRAFT_529285 [Armillaria mellea]|nr:hypothetical protein F5146DRAFT_529285 [Armillaria mellea]
MHKHPVWWTGRSFLPSKTHVHVLDMPLTPIWDSADCMISPELFAALRIAVICSFIACVIISVYWEEVRKFCRAYFIKLFAALIICASLTQLDSWLLIPDIRHGFEGDFPMSILLGTRSIITSASRIMVITMISCITVIVWRFAPFKPEILLSELVVHRSLRIGEAVLDWLLTGKADGL